MIDKAGIASRLKGRGGKAVFALGLAGILLIGLSSLGGVRKSEEQKEDVFDPAAYRAELEDGVREIIKSITGGREASVMITLDSGRRYVYADEGRSTVNSAGSDNEQSYTVLRGSDGGERGLLVAEYLPEVRGAAIVCAGISDETVESIRAAVTAALDISSKKVYVTTGG